jgi:hypothetical protein
MEVCECWINNSRSLSFSVSLSLCLSVSLSLCLYISITLSTYLSASLSVSISVCPFYLCLYLGLFMSLCLYLSMSLSPLHFYLLFWATAIVFSCIKAAHFRIQIIANARYNLALGIICKLESEFVKKRCGLSKHVRLYAVLSPTNYEKMKYCSRSHPFGN